MTEAASDSTSQMSGATTPARPIADDADTWKSYWQAQGMSWRTEPEVATERQAYLTERRAITPNVEQGIYPFKDIEPKLARADIEWLLATHDGGSGPIVWDMDAPGISRDRGTGLDLRGADLSKLDLSNLPLTRMCGSLTIYQWRDANNQQKAAAQVHLEEAILRGAHLEGSSLSHALLENADLSMAHLEEANLREARLVGVDLKEAFLTRADLFGAQLANTNLSRTHLENVNLIEANMADTDLFGARLERADLSKAILDDADLSKAILDYADLNRATLTNANLGEASLQGAHLTEATVSNASLREALLMGADFTVARLEKTNFIDAQLDDVNLTNAHLEGASFRSAHLERANFTEAHLEHANFTEAHLGDANFTQAHMKGAILQEAQFAGADLRLTVFDSTTILNDVVLGNAEFGGVRLADVRWGGVNLAVIDWAPIVAAGLGDELVARQRQPPLPKEDDISKRRSRRERARARHMQREQLAAEHLQTFQAAVRANRQLATALRDQGMNEEADAFAYRAQVVQRSVFAQQGKRGRAILSLFLDLLAGHGYKPARSLYTSLGVLFGFAFLFFLAGNGWLTFGLPASQYQDLPWYEALILSVSSFHGRGFFQPLQTLGDPVAIIASVEAVFGLFIEVAFIATFTQRFFGK